MCMHSGLFAFTGTRTMKSIFLLSICGVLCACTVAAPRSRQPASKVWELMPTSLDSVRSDVGLRTNKSTERSDDERDTSVLLSAWEDQEAPGGDHILGLRKGDLFLRGFQHGSHHRIGGSRHSHPSSPFHGTFNMDESACSGIEERSCISNAECKGCFGFFKCSSFHKRCAYKGVSRKIGTFLQSSNSPY
uniref:Secreted protein n=2 Tax=Eptatretus burgeri TaxID=7764 RepID=A0A8C4R9T9_EPTBU